MKIKGSLDNSDTQKREIAYPAYPLDEAMKVAEAVSELGGARSAVPKSLLAKHMKYAESGPSFFQRVSAAKSFKTIDGWGSYSLTEEAKRYFFPTSETDKQRGRVAFLRGPAAFAVIIKRFDGAKLPSTEMLGNVLHNEASVPATWKDKVAALFIRSAQFAGVVDAAGFLKCDATMHSTGSRGDGQPAEEQPALITPTPSDDETPPTRYKRVAGKLNLAPKVFTHTEIDRATGAQKVVLVETPEDLTPSSWELLNYYVQSLKPKEAGG